LPRSRLRRCKYSRRRARWRQSDIWSFQGAVRELQVHAGNVHGRARGSMATLDSRADTIDRLLVTIVGLGLPGSKAASARHSHSSSPIELSRAGARRSACGAERTAAAGKGVGGGPLADEFRRAPSRPRLASDAAQGGPRTCLRRGVAPSRSRPQGHSDRSAAPGRPPLAPPHISKIGGGHARAVPVPRSPRAAKSRQS
jgi:hypothetical protein